MEKIIQGKIYVLGDNIDTDQIIPAEHLVYSMVEEAEAIKYGMYALSGVEKGKAGLPFGNIPFVEKGKYISQYSIIIAGKNFGCGSSREHAPFALYKAGIKAIVANSYARIFYRNCIDGGFLVPLEIKEDIWRIFETDEYIVINLEQLKLTRLKTNHGYHLKELGAVADIINAGGIFKYAKLKEMI